MIPPQVFIARKILWPFPFRNQLRSQNVIYCSTPITPSEALNCSLLLVLEVIQFLFVNSDWISAILGSKD
jgi:hypothetical protein